MKIILNISLVLLTFFVFFFFSCNSDKGYEILDTQPLETPTKAQLTIKAVLKNELCSEDDKRRYLMQLYSSAKNYNKFKNFEAPTVIAIFLYISERKAIDDPSMYAARLIKYRGVSNPKINFEPFHKENSDQLLFEKLSTQFKAAGVDFCDIYLQLEHISSDAKSYAKSDPYSSVVEYEKEKRNYCNVKEKELFKQYNLPDSDIMITKVFGMRFCK